MKKIVEDLGEGMESLLGERVDLWCLNYIYTGKLIGVNETCVKLTDCSLVYDTGDLDAKKFSNVQKFPNDRYVQTQAIESFGLSNVKG